MMKIVSANDPSTWQTYLDLLDVGRKDPHYLSQYLKLLADLPDGPSKTYFGGEAFLCVYSLKDNFVLYPFFKRPQRLVEPGSNESVKIFDIVSPYGYGGPLVVTENDASQELLESFFQEFHRYCQEQNVVSEFCRLHPLFQNHLLINQACSAEIRDLGKVVYVDLNQTDERILQDMHPSRKRNARRAIARNCTYQFGNIDDRIKDFYDIYVATMQRRGAQDRYYFPLTFFEMADQYLGEHLHFAYVENKGKMIAGCLMLIYGEVAYYWLGGSNAEYLAMNPNDLLFVRAILDIKKTGAKYLVLGGGVGVSEDTLFVYKTRFSSLTRDFYVYSKVHLGKQYKMLTANNHHTE